MADADYGYLLAHFREDPDGYAERIHFSVSDGDDPLRWTPLWGGQPVLTSDLGTTGVRDPAIVRDDAGRFHLLATDLRVWGGDGGDWASWSRHGSRDLILWDSDDLVTWAGPRALTVVDETAGMAWAPEVIRDPAGSAGGDGEFIVFWSSRLFAVDDPDHAAESYSRILCARTRDFRDFGPAEVLIDAGRDIIDTAMVQHDGRTFRFSKDETPGGLGMYQEVGSGIFADDFRIVATRIGADLFGGVEGPMIVEDPRGDGWYLFLDQYSRTPQGYVVLRTDDLESGEWMPVPDGRASIPPATKHGTILRLRGDEWERLSALR